MEPKPDIASVQSAEELRRWYWKKEELIQRARQLGVSYEGGKFTILERIASYLSGNVETKSSTSPTSTFDWRVELITEDTVITDSYRNTQNVRAFMRLHEPLFKFSIDFMNWMRSNQGKTMRDALAFYTDLQRRTRSGAYTPQIEPHNQYNQYLRDFFHANPTLSQQQAVQCWTHKTLLPSENGRHTYEDTDLAALGE